MTADEESRLLADFIEGVLSWDAVGFDTPKKANKKANKIFLQFHRTARKLQATPAGRAGLESLMSHESAAVRVIAAGRVLTWDPDKSVPVLERLRDSTGGRHGFSAEYTLKGYNEGTLDLHWSPAN
jgi:hypothetical protein